MPSDANWIAADWGTTHLRVWHVSPSGEVRGEAKSNKGMAAIAPNAFEPALLELIGPWLEPSGRTQVIACGMVGARQGWIEADYVQIPAKPLARGKFQLAPCKDERLNVFIIPGLKQDAPADVMRGEETQIAGFLASRPGFSGTLCMPGTHTKWVEVNNGEVVRFASSMTGELFALISSQSVLKHSVSFENDNNASFHKTVESVLQSEQSGYSDLFSIRAEDLLHERSPAEARGKLSGLLIGTEVADRRDWLKGDIVILGEPQLTALYGIAISCAGASAERLEATDLTLNGLCAAHAAIESEMS